MNSNIKTIAAFLIGAGMGSVCTYYIIKEKLESKFNEEADEKIDSIKKRYKEKEDKLKESIDKPDILDVAKELEKKEYEDKVNELGYSDNDESSKNNDISIITMDQFDDEALDFEKVSLIFYKGDSTLADEEDTALNAILHIGQAGLEEATNTLDDSVYIRNFKTNRDYEISIEDGCYSDIVGEEYSERDE